MFITMSCWATHTTNCKTYMQNLKGFFVLFLGLSHNHAKKLVHYCSKNRKLWSLPGEKQLWAWMKARFQSRDQKQIKGITQVPHMCFFLPLKLLTWVFLPSPPTVCYYHVLYLLGTPMKEAAKSLSPEKDAHSYNTFRHLITRSRNIILRRM